MLFSGLMQKLFNEFSTLLVSQHCIGKSHLEIATDIYITYIVLIVIQLNSYSSVEWSL